MLFPGAHLPLPMATNPSIPLNPPSPLFPQFFRAHFPFFSPIPFRHLPATTNPFLANQSNGGGIFPPPNFHQIHQNQQQNLLRLMLGMGSRMEQTNQQQVWHLTIGGNDGLEEW